MSIGSAVLGSNDAQYQAWFDEMARHVLNRFVLSLGDGKSLCRLTEIEFYYSERNGSSSYRHYDPFCHQHGLELTPNLWYFLRAGPLDHHDYKV